MTISDKKYTWAPGFLARMKTPIKIDLKMDVPYLSGHSKDMSTLYIDRSLKRFFLFKGKRTDAVKYLIVYQKSLMVLIDLYGLVPDKAHELATKMEFEAISKDGIDWKEYEKHLSPQMKIIKKCRSIPKDLSLDIYDKYDQRKIQAVKGPERPDDYHRRFRQRAMSALSPDPTTA